MPSLPDLPNLSRVPGFSSDTSDASDPGYELGLRREQLVVDLRLLRDLGSKRLVGSLRVALAERCRERYSLSG